MDGRRPILTGSTILAAQRFPAVVAAATYTVDPAAAAVTAERSTVHGRTPAP